MQTTLSEMLGTATVGTPVGEVEIPATKWGYCEDIAVDLLTLEPNADKALCITFTAETGHTGGRVRVEDLLETLAAHYPEMLHKALDSTATRE